MIRLLVLLLCVAAGGVAWGDLPLLEVRYLDNVEVSSSKILFRDIAVITGEGPGLGDLKNTTVGKSANFGLSRWLSTHQIYIRFLKPLEARYNVRGHEDKRIRITTRAGAYPQDSLIRKIEQFLDGNPTGGIGGYYEYELLSSPGNIRVPTGGFTLGLRAPETYKRRGRQALELVIEADEGAKRVLPFSVFIRNFDSVWVSRGRIGRASRITRNQLKREYRDITRLSGVPVRSVGELEGKKTKQTIIAGRIVTNKLITLEPLIRQGQKVKVTAHRNGIVLTLEGVARQDGCIGQIIRVKNLVTHKLVRARVLEGGRLEFVSLVTRG